MKSALICVSFLIVFAGNAQNISPKISRAYQQFSTDTSLKHSVVSFYIVNSKTGKIVFNKNEQTGLPAGSVQKVITSATAFELLGNNYAYKTVFSYTGNIVDSTLHGNLLIKGSGDPSLGSSRFASSSEKNMLSEIRNALKISGIKNIAGAVIADDNLWQGESISDHWIWQDIGNYYGAGASTINWKENMYDVVLRSGKNIGDAVNIVKTIPTLSPKFTLRSEAVAAAKGSGDNTYIYLPLKNSEAVIRGTIPVLQDNFVVSGSLPDPAKQLEFDLGNSLSVQNISSSVNNEVSRSANLFIHDSPSLDSLNYWFLQKSINLYGEAFLKTIAYEKTRSGSTDSGVNIIKDFWSSRGIERAALRIYDGSGLSPENRITTHALVTVMQYAKKQAWYKSFYNALPEINKTKMKSGTIGGTLAYTGYVTSASGTEYTFAIIVNNYEGKTQPMREKIWRLLNILK